MLFLQAFLLAFASPAYALSNYTRGPGTPSSPEAPNRFLYMNPFYQRRVVQTKHECKPHGQARCMGPKKPDPFVLTRTNPAMQQTNVNPFARKIFQPAPIQRIN
jgi:hypothetical protein